MDISNIYFGTSGVPDNYFKTKYKKDRMNIVDWLNDLGLNAYEHLYTYGVRGSEEKNKYIKQKISEYNMMLSLHSPYYIVLTSDKKETIENSKKELIKTLDAAKYFNCKRIVLHPGFTNNENALNSFITNLQEIIDIHEFAKYIVPESMGKKSQLGSLEDIIKICQETGIKPCIDFGHLHARDLGSLNNEDNFRNVITKLEKELGHESIKHLHCHFYPVAYTDKGEKVHRAVMEEDAFPKFIHFAPIIKEFNMMPVLISESHNSQDIGALQMKDILKRI
jgi:deoxyribonuclease-4